MTKTNLGLFGDGWRATPAEDAFLKYIAPIYRRASQEGKKATFFELLWPVWFDRFPVILCGEDFEGKGIDSDHVEWAKGLQKNVSPCLS